MERGQTTFKPNPHQGRLSTPSAIFALSRRSVADRLNSDVGLAEGKIHGLLGNWFFWQ